MAWDTTTTHTKLDAGPTPRAVTAGMGTACLDTTTMRPPARVSTRAWHTPLPPPRARPEGSARPRPRSCWVPCERRAIIPARARTARCRDTNEMWWARRPNAHSGSGAHDCCRRRPSHSQSLATPLQCRVAGACAATCAVHTTWRAGARHSRTHYGGARHMQRHAHLSAAALLLRAGSVAGLV